MRVKRILFILAGLLIVLTMQNVLAIGITPGRTTINFEPSLHKEVSFSIINSEHKDMSVIFMIKGELSESITLSQAYAEFSSSEDSKSFTYVIDLPEQFERPGLHTADIVALEVPKDTVSEGAIIGATVAVVSQLHVYVPYPGKYVELDVDIIEASPGQFTMFIISVVNRGRLNIKRANARIEIYSKDKLIDKIETEEIGLLVGERKEFIKKWDTNVDIGKYKAKIILTYDGEERILEKDFNVGEAKLEIELITVKDFALGEIAKFNILVNNKWGEEIKDVRVNMIVYGELGNTLAEIKTPNYDVPSLSKVEMIAYWDTEGMEEGIYDGKLILSYGKDKNEKNVKIKITEDSIEVTGLTGHVIIKGKGRFNSNNLLIILVIFLILANIVWFFIVKRLKKKRS